ncbi:hypothetical protein KC955_00175 [Candidatus Saccharibacteria bacterium]|nr:hypothetical protein [Candidatus Saccharibacteria bacterium]
MNRYSDEQIQSIRRLRELGATYSEIAAELGIVIPKSSLTYICRDIRHSTEYTNKINELNRSHLMAARKKALKANKKLLNDRVSRISQLAVVAVESVEDKLAYKMMLAMLYLGEGRKRSSYRGLSLGNSDPDVLVAYIGLLEVCYGKARAEMRARVQYRHDQDIVRLTEYWSEQLGFCREQFYKTTPDSRTKSKPTKDNDYMGVCVVSCSGADIQLELAMIAKRFAEKLRGYSSVD